MGDGDAHRGDGQSMPARSQGRCMGDGEAAPLGCPCGHRQRRRRRRTCLRALGGARGASCRRRCSATRRSSVGRAASLNLPWSAGGKGRRRLRVRGREVRAEHPDASESLALGALLSEGGRRNRGAPPSARSRTSGDPGSGDPGTVDQGSGDPGSGDQGSGSGCVFTLLWLAGGRWEP